MELLLILLASALLARWCFRWGKRTGSRKAYYVGRRRAHRRTR